MKQTVYQLYGKAEHTWLPIVTQEATFYRTEEKARYHLLEMLERMRGKITQQGGIYTLWSNSDRERQVVEYKEIENVTWQRVIMKKIPWRIAEYRIKTIELEIVE